MKEFEPYSDAELIQKILNGETELFEILIRRTNPFLYKIGRSYNYNHQDTEDLMQDSFINAYQHLRSFENRSSFKTWIIKIMLNNCYKRKQKFSYQKEKPADISNESVPAFTERQYTDANNIIMNRELTTIIEQALQEVPLDYRLVFSLREMNGLSIKETAEALAITETNVKVRLSRAKALLRKEVEKSYTADEIFEFNLIYCDAMVNKVMSLLKELEVY